MLYLHEDSNVIKLERMLYNMVLCSRLPLVVLGSSREVVPICLLVPSGVRYSTSKQHRDCRMGFVLGWLFLMGSCCLFFGVVSLQVLISTERGAALASGCAGL